MNYKGDIIQESLKNVDVMNYVKILSTRVEKVADKHNTPWIKQWTLHNVEVGEGDADKISKLISKNLDYSHGTSWYADFKNEMYHYIIFKGKIFKIDRSKKDEYQKATNYGLSLGIPPYQVDFSPNVVEWKR